MDPFDCFDTLSPKSLSKDKSAGKSIDEMNEKQLFQNLNARFRELIQVKQSSEECDSLLDESHLEKLLSPLIINHPRSSIKILGACVVSEALRIAAPKFPFEEKYIEYALTLLIEAISGLHDHSSQSDHMCHSNHLISSLAQTHAIYALCKKSSNSQEEIDKNSFRVVKSLLFFGKRDSTIGMQCAEVITDTIMAYCVITEDVFSLLVDELKKNSVVAKLVLASHSLQMQDLIHHYFKKLCDELVQECGKGISNGEEKRKAFRGINHMFEVIQKVALTSALCIKKTIESVILYTTSEHSDLRMLFIKGLGKLFEADPLLLLESEVPLKAFLVRFEDARPVVRNEMLRVIHRIIRARSSHQITKKVWQFFGEPVKARLVDHDESVRKNALLMLTSLDINSAPEALVQAVTLRCRDKKISVRHFAISQLGKAVEFLKNQCYTRWISNAIIHTYDADEGTNHSIVESIILQFVRTYADRFDVLCELLDNQSLKILETIFSKINRLRWVVVRLFELKRDLSQDEIAKSLVHFLSNQLPMQHVDTLEEWTAISEIKDLRFRRSIADSFVFAEDFHESLDRVKKICRKSTCDYLSRVTGRLLLPINREFASQLAERLKSVKEEDRQTGILRAYCLLFVYEPSVTSGIQCITDSFSSEMEKVSSKSDSRCFERINFLLEFFCQVGEKMKELQHLFRSAAFCEKLAMLLISLPLSSYFLCRSIAKSLALFLAEDELECEKYLKYLKNLYETVDIVRQARIKLIYTELIKKESFILGKGFFPNQDENLTDLKNCIDSLEEESPMTLRASMRLQKAYFDAQAQLNDKKAANYVTLLIDAAMRLRENGHEFNESKSRYILKHLVSLLCSCKIRLCIFDDMPLLQSLANLFGGIFSKDSRGMVQKKMFKHLYCTRELPLQCSVFLLITLLAENSRHNLSKTREYWRTIIETFRNIAIKEMSSKNITLSDASAISCYPEYVFPILLYLLAHSSSFLRERDASLLSIQRVLVVFFEEVLGRTNESAGFLLELIRRIRSLDDRYCAETPNTRVLSEISLKVIQEVLRTRSLTANSIYAFPGSVQLPHFFKESRKSTAFLESTDFLPKNFSLIRMGFGGMFSLNHVADGPPEADLELHYEPENNINLFENTSKISEVVKKLYGNLTEDEIALVSWKKMRQEIAESLGVNELDEDVRMRAWKAIQALHDEV